MTLSRISLIVAGFVILLVGFALGFLFSYAGIHYSSSDKAKKLDKLIQEDNEEWSKILLDSVSSHNLRGYLK